MNAHFEVDVSLSPSEYTGLEKYNVSLNYSNLDLPEPSFKDKFKMAGVGALKYAVSAVSDDANWISLYDV